MGAVEGGASGLRSLPRLSGKPHPEGGYEENRKTTATKSTSAQPAMRWRAERRSCGMWAGGWSAGPLGARLLPGMLVRAPLELISAGNPLVPECRFQICYFTGLTSM